MSAGDREVVDGWVQTLCPSREAAERWRDDFEQVCFEEGMPEPRLTVEPSRFERGWWAVLLWTE